MEKTRTHTEFCENFFNSIILNPNVVLEAVYFQNYCTKTELNMSAALVDPQQQAITPALDDPGGVSPMVVVTTPVAAATTTTTTPMEDTKMAVNVAAAATVEELPYFPETYPGKLCCLCNLGERSQLGQGEMIRVQWLKEEMSHDDSASSIFDTDELMPDAESSASSKDNGTESNAHQLIVNNKRQKGVNKCK